MSQSIAHLLTWAQAELAVSGASDSPRLEVELLLAKALGQSRSYLFTWPERVPNADQLAQFQRWVAQRQEGTPVAYLLGEQGFWTLDLNVTPATLIPRPETELLVELALDLPLDQRFISAAESVRILDLGTGTGAIALALASERPQWHITAVDNSAEALVVARENAQRNHLDQVEFLRSDWFQQLESGQGFDMIVSNPPYIAADDYHLQDGDLRFEPSSALVADRQGMADIEAIAQGARDHLKPGGWLLFEHGYDQGPAAVNLLADLGYDNVCCHRDMGERNRVCQGRWR